MKYTEISIIKLTTILSLASTLYVTILFSQSMYQLDGSVMVPSITMNGEVFDLAKILASDGSYM